MADTIYFNGFSAKQSKYGIKLSGNVEKIIAALKEHTNSKGYINLEIVPRREPDKFGNTHTVKVDTWEPSGASQQVGNPKEVEKEKEPEKEFRVEDTGEELPF